MIGAFHELVGQLLWNKAPEFALSFAQGMSRDVSLSGPTGDRFFIHTEEFTGFSRVEKFTLRHYVSWGHEWEYLGRRPHLEYELAIFQSLADETTENGGS